jgi:hypothetical protein
MPVVFDVSTDHHVEPHSVEKGAASSWIRGRVAFLMGGAATAKLVIWVGVSTAPPHFPRQL